MESLATAFTRPRLPNEILDLVINSITDKPTVAKLMRVSSTINHMAAPRLYAHVKWRTNHVCPLAATPHEGGSLVRVSPPKSHILNHVRTVHLCFQSLLDCPLLQTEDGKTIVLPIDILRYAVRSHNNDSLSQYTNKAQNHVHTSGRDCSFLSGLAPAKLIIDHAVHNDHLPVRFIDKRRLSKIVVNINLFVYSRFRHGEQPRVDFRAFGNSPARSKSVVFIISDLYTGPPVLGAQHSHFCSKLADETYRANFASIILVVNATGLFKNENGRIISRQAQDISPVAVRLLMCTEERLCQLKFSWGLKLLISRWKNVAEAEATTIKFIDLQEYLRDHDTTGEFTDEERAIWKSVGAENEEDRPYSSWIYM